MSDTLAARLKDLRLKAGLSQYALADRLQENRQRLAAYEQGRFEPPLDLATRWAAACGANLQIVLDHPARTRGGRDSPPGKVRAFPLRAPPMIRKNFLTSYTL